MSSSALESQGVTLSIDTSTTSTATYTPLINLKDFSFRTGSATVIDTTDLSSTAKEKRMGLQDEGQCTFTLQINPKNSGHAELLEAKSDRVARKFRIVLTDVSTPTTYYFLGYVLSVPMNGSVDGVLESSVTVEITGSVDTTLL